MNKQIKFPQALLMAIGTVIGSGLFFKSDDVLRYSQGNVLIAILGWLLLGSTLIFAGIATSVVIARTTKHGGFGAYIEELYNEKAGFASSWFFAVIYSPTQNGILAWVTITFALQIFGQSVDSIGVNNFYILFFILLVTVFIWNMLSTKFTALFSSIATVIKLVPLIVIPLLAFTGFSPADFSNIFDGANTVANNPAAIEIINNSGDVSFDKDANFLKLFTAPLLAMAFTFDGWHTAGSFSVDMENPQRDLAKVFAFNALILTIIYIVYFTGINIFMPADQIIIQGNDHVGVIAQQVFGKIGGETFGFYASKSVIIFVCISVLGALNGGVIGGIRYIQALGEEDQIPYSSKLKKFSHKLGTPFNAGIASLILAIICFFIYYAQEAHGLISGIVIDELPIALTALIFIPLMVGVIRIYLKERKQIFKTLIAPLVAIVGQLFILIAFFLNNNQALLYLIICSVIVLIGLLVRNLHKKAVH